MCTSAVETSVHFQALLHFLVYLDQYPTLAQPPLLTHRHPRPRPRPIRRSPPLGLAPSTGFAPPALAFAPSTAAPATLNAFSGFTSFSTKPDRRRVRMPLRLWRFLVRVQRHCLFWPIAHQGPRSRKRSLP